MKKLLFYLLAFIPFGLGVQAQTVSVADIEALSEGETVLFNLHVSGVTAMTSMHFEVELPATFSVSGVSATSDWAAMFSREGGVVGAISSSDNALNGDGDAATVSVTVPSGTAVGEYPVTIDNIRINGTELGTSVVFHINVVAKHCVVLDELSTTPPVAATGVNVKVLRTIKAGNWSTICLPFAMSEEQAKSAFGDDVQLKDFTSWSSGKNGDGDIISLTIGFTTVTAIEANHPYLIKVSSAISEFTIEGVDIDPEDEPYKKVGKGSKKGVFYGNYVAETKVPEYNLFISNDKFYYSNGSTKTKAFRGYFELYDILASVEEAGARINMIDGTMTGITDVAGNTSDGDEYYDLLGRRVKTPKQGLYIKNNKKVVVK